MMNTLKEWWPIVAFAFTCIAGGGMAFLVVTRVKVPNIERRLTSLEKTVKEDVVDKLKLGFLVKTDLYDENHILRFIGRGECGNMRHSCANGVAYDINEVKEIIEGQVKEARANRTLLMMFMAAVKERLDLKLEMPEVH